MEMFQFQGFSPSMPIRMKANRLLNRLLEEAPTDSKMAATLSWDGQEYRCQVDLASRLYPLAVSAGHWNAAIAIDKAELAVARKLSQRGVRFAAEAQALPAGARA